MAIKLNGVNVAIMGLDKWNGYLCVFYTLDGYRFLDWVKSDGAKYKLESSKADFIADNDEYYRCVVDIKDDAEYMDFLSNLYDYLQDYVKNCCVKEGKHD